MKICPMCENEVEVLLISFCNFCEEAVEEFKSYEDAQDGMEIGNEKNQGRRDKYGAQLSPYDLNNRRIKTTK